MRKNCGHATHDIQGTNNSPSRFTKSGGTVVLHYHWSKWIFTFIAVLLICGILSFSLLVLLGYYSTWGLKDDAGNPIDWNRLARNDYNKATVVYDSRRDVLGLHFKEMRIPISSENIPAIVINAFIAAEDQRFWDHPGIDGVDVYAIIRAIASDSAELAGAGDSTQVGASTIAMQLAKILYENDVAVFRNRGNNETAWQKVWRKVVEIRFAVQLCRRYEKKKILEGLLNAIYMGDGTLGISAASYHYFGKNCSDIAGPGSDLKTAARQAVMLAALNKSAEAFNPIYKEFASPPRAPDEDDMSFAQRVADIERRRDREQKRIVHARIRWNWNLRRMQIMGFLDETSLQQALFSLSTPWQQEEVRPKAMKDKDNGYANRFVKELLLTSGMRDSVITQSGGLSIFTSIDAGIQKILSEELRNHLAILNSELATGAEKLQGAAVVLDLKTSRILAITGGENFFKSPFNRAMSLRSAGSASKLAVYCAYLEATGRSYEDVLPNIPFTMTSQMDVHGHTTQIWSPDNFQEKKPVPYGMRRIDEVFTRSVNLPALWAVREIGIATFVDMAHRLGMWGTRGVVRDPNGTVVLKTLRADMSLKDGIDPYLPTAISMNVNLLELANAFATVGRRGMYLPPTIIREIKDGTATVLYTASVPEPMQVVDPEVCRKMTVLLRGVTEIGTLKISMRDIMQKVAAKTGTGHETMDVQVVEMTPDVVLAVRIGYDQPKPIQLPAYMKTVSGDDTLNLSAGWVVGPLARRYIDALYEKRSITAFPEDINNDLNMIIERYKDN